MSNEKFSYLAHCFYYSAENVTPKIAAETDMFSLSERYGRTLKATQEVSSSRVPRVYFFSFIIYLFI